MHNSENIYYNLTIYIHIYIYIYIYIYDQIKRILKLEGWLRFLFDSILLILCYKVKTF